MSCDAVGAVAWAPSRPWRVEPIRIDAPGRGEVLVRIAGTGLCHTDLVFAGSMKVMRAPAIFGHEGAGTVERVGPGVTKVKPGDRVVLTFNSCGECASCLADHPAYCTEFIRLNYSGCRADGSRGIHVGDDPAAAHFFGQSSFASHALAVERNVVVIGDDTPLELMGPLGCGVQTGAGSVINVFACPTGSTLLVVGGGAVGLSAVMAGVVRGCGAIILVEPKAARRTMALELGATHVIDPAAGDVAGQVRAIVPGGVEFAFDTSGIPAAIDSALQCLGVNGMLGLVGVAADGEDMVNLPINRSIGSGWTVKGIIEGDAVPDTFIPHLIDLYRAGRFPFDRLIRTYRLTEINQAIEDQLSGACIKPVLIP